MVAPSAPVLTSAPTGGNLSAGTYLVAVALVNSGGDQTPASAQSSIVLAGTTSVLIVASPASALGALGWYAYVSQPGGAILTLQGVTSSPLRLGPPFVLATAPSSSGVAPLTYGSALVASDVADLYNPAAECCETIAARFARLAQSRTIGKLSIEAANKYKQYLQMANVLRQKMAMSIYVGGISEADKAVSEEDDDVVQPFFTRGMMKENIVSAPSPQQDESTEAGSADVVS